MGNPVARYNCLRATAVARRYALHCGKQACGWRDSFRLDINALRALSVLAVLGYHLKIPGFAGGFVGVDVFRVITGYLMDGNQARAGRAIDEWKVEADPVLTMSGLRGEVSKILDKYKGNPRLVAIDPLPVVGETTHCYLVRSGQSNFRDSVHISNVNAMQYTGLFDAAFRLALQAANAATKETDGWREPWGFLAAPQTIRRS